MFTIVTNKMVNVLYVYSKLAHLFLQVDSQFKPWMRKFPIRLGIILRSHFENLIFSPTENKFILLYEFHRIHFVQFDDGRKNIQMRIK